MQTDLFSNIYRIVKQIPHGRVTTYGAIAVCIGTKQSARMVGWAMSASHSVGDVPAHRVVNKQGLLTGRLHFATPDTMAQLLESEGITVVNNAIINFESFFWNPAIELAIHHTIL